MSPEFLLEKMIELNAYVPDTREYEQFQEFEHRVLTQQEQDIQESIRFEFDVSHKHRWLLLRTKRPARKKKPAKPKREPESRGYDNPKSFFMPYDPEKTEHKDRNGSVWMGLVGVHVD